MPIITEIKDGVRARQKGAPVNRMWEVVVVTWCLMMMAALAGCGQSAASASPTGKQLSAAPPSLVLQVASSDLSVGVNRFTFGVIYKNHPLTVPTAQTTFYVLNGSTGTVEAMSVAHFNDFAGSLPHTLRNSAATQIGGVYVTSVRFHTPGPHGIEVRIRVGGTFRTVRSQFMVTPRSQTPALGSLAPQSANPTIAQVPATRLDSARPPDDMHVVRIADAIRRHHPLVVLFATAAYCQSRLCGPEIEQVQGLERKYRNRVDFVHIEIYKDAVYSHGFAPAVLQWHLLSEPWVFVVNRQGRITAKFEGPTTGAEIEPAIRAVSR